MSYRHTLEAALESLHEIEDLIKTFPSDGNIPNIEIDLTLQKIRNVYELLLMMKKEERTVAVADGKVATAAAVDGKVAAAVAAADGKAAAAAVAADGEVAAAVAAAVENPVNKTDAITPATATAAAAASPVPAPTQTLSDQFKGRTTLHESLHQTLHNEGETLAHGKPVTHLMTAIGINDRFTFIRELFNNDANAFETTMGILNDASSFNDAYNHMIQHFDWDMDSEAVQQLLDIIRRKFIKNRHE